MGPTWRRHRSSVSATDWGRLVADTFQLSVCGYVVVLVFVFGLISFVYVFVLVFVSDSGALGGGNAHRSLPTTALGTLCENLSPGCSWKFTWREKYLQITRKSAIEI